MKNHIKVDGRLLQTNKKWSQLKQKQREWICEITREEYRKYLIANKSKPYKKRKGDIVNAVYDRINERGIWIPFREAETAICKIIDQQNRIVEFAIVDGEVIL